MSMFEDQARAAGFKITTMEDAYGNKRRLLAKEIDGKLYGVEIPPEDPKRENVSYIIAKLEIYDWQLSEHARKAR